MPPDFERTVWIDRPQWSPRSSRHKHFNLPLRLVLEESRRGTHVGVETVSKVRGKHRFIGYLPEFLVPHVAGGLRAKAPIEVRFIDVGRRGRWCSIDIFCEGSAFYGSQAKMGREIRERSREELEARAKRLADRREKLRGTAAKTAAISGQAGAAVGKAVIAGGRRAPSLIASAWRKLVLWTNR